MDVFADYAAAQKEVNRNYKLMDEALSAAVMDELGWDVPKVISYTDPTTGDRYAINITARAALIERGLPQEE